MKKRVINWFTKISGLFLILFAFLSDPLRGRDFQFGWAQGLFFAAGLVSLLLGWLYSKNRDKLFFAVVFLVTLFGFLILKFQIFELDDFRVWTDTESYVKTAVLQLSQQGFWFGLRPFLLPLIYKVFGVNLVNYYEGGFMSRVLWFQFGLGAAAWMLLAWAFSRHFKDVLLRSAAVILTALLGLGLHASMWDKLLLSESLSNSLFLLVVAQVLLLVKTPSPKRAWWGVGGLLATLFFFIAIRDANVYFVLQAAAVGLLALFFFKGHRQQILTACLAAAAMAFISFVLVNQSQRWWAPVQHTLYDRRQTEPQLVKYFDAKSYDLMRMDKELTAAEAENASLPVDFEHEQTLRALKSLYTRFLISHPGYVVSIPAADLAKVLSPVNTEYRYNRKVTPAWVPALTNVAYPAGSWIYLAGLGACLLVFLLNGRKLEPALLVMFFLLASAWPLGLLIWHSDTMEIERHAQQLMIQSRVGFWFALLLLASGLIEKAEIRKKLPDHG